MDRPKLAFGVEPAKWKYRLRLARYAGLAEALAEFVRAPRPGGNPKVELLDVGVGNGRTLRYCESAGVADQINFYGVDSSPRRLGQVYGGPLWQLRQVDVQAGLPFADNRFDAVVCEQLLEHVPDSLAVIKEMTRVLVPGGLLVAGVPIFRPLPAYLRRTLVPKLDRLLGTRRDHVQAFTKSAFCRLLQRGGDLEIREARGFRVFSGGPLRFLENYHWWYRFQRFLGRHFPSCCIEVQVLAHKRPSPRSLQCAAA